MSDFSRGLLSFCERFDCMADLFRSFQRQEVARTCNLDVLCQLHPWEDFSPDDAWWNDWILTSDRNKNRTVDEADLGRDVLTASVLKPPAPRLRRGEEVILYAGRDVFRLQRAACDSMNCAFRRGAVAVRGE